MKSSKQASTMYVEIFYKILCSNIHKNTLIHLHVYFEIKLTFQKYIHILICTFRCRIDYLFTFNLSSNKHTTLTITLKETVTQHFTYQPIVNIFCFQDSRTLGRIFVLTLKTSTYVYTFLLPTLEWNCLLLEDSHYGGNSLPRCLNEEVEVHLIDWLLFLPIPGSQRSTTINKIHTDMRQDSSRNFIVTCPLHFSFFTFTRRYNVWVFLRVNIYIPFAAIINSTSSGERFRIPTYIY